MKRDVYTELKKWQTAKDRRPLLVRGARQIGKSYILEEFGQNEFDSTVLLNFERNPQYNEVFNELNPKTIIENIALYTRQQAIPGKTLLVFDEIQECPNALLSLRYFYEELPELHIIAAGSLLEFALNAEDFRMPVGRIQYLYMKPMSFGEFLDAMGETALRKHISDFDKLKTIPEHLHQKLIDLLRRYSIIGGMPAVIKEYISGRDILKCQEIQHSIIETFVDDFSKYARKTKITNLRKVFSTMPAMIGNKFVYAKVDNSVKSRELKEAVELLEQAGIITRIKLSNGSGLPLESNVKENYFKLLFLDIGLVHAISGVLTETISEKDYTAVYKGSIAEQFAGQELIAYSHSMFKPKLYYWARDAKNSSAEIDYLISKNEDIIPIEVKSGSTGRAKSLLMFIEKYNTKTAYKISQAKFNAKDVIIELPLYAICHIC